MRYSKVLSEWFWVIEQRAQFDPALTAQPCTLTPADETLSKFLHVWDDYRL